MSRRVDLSKRACSLSRTVEIVGDRWTLLVLRDVCMGVGKFDELVASLDIARNTLTDRLRSLETHRMIEHRAASSGSGAEYGATDMGRSFFPILLAMISWGDRWAAGTKGPPRLFRHPSCRSNIDARVVCHRCGTEIDVAEVSSREGPGADD